MRRLLTVVALLAGACVGGEAEVREPVPTLFDDSTSTSIDVVEQTSAPTVTTTLPVIDRLPELPTDVPGAVLADGMVLPIIGTDGDAWFLLGPCGEDRVAPASTAVTVAPQHVVLDPGGGDDPAGVANLALAERTAELLAADGVQVLLTRTTAVELSASTRGAVGPAVGARVLVSLHRSEADAENAGGDARPTVFPRAGDADSRRLGGLLHQAVADAIEPHSTAFVSGAEPGVRPLLNQRGADYFRVLQTSAGVAAVRVELPAAAQNDPTLLAEEEGRDIEARALADGIIRYLVTNEEGDGFVDPVEAVRTAPTSNTPGGC